MVLYDWLQPIIQVVRAVRGSSTLITVTDLKNPVPTIFFSSSSPHFRIQEEPASRPFCCCYCTETSHGLFWTWEVGHRPKEPSTHTAEIVDTGRNADPAVFAATVLAPSLASESHEARLWSRVASLSTHSAAQGVE